MSGNKEKIRVNSAAAQIYHNRLQKVLCYIEENLEGDLSVETLSGIAAFSKYHFHRQFTALFGMNVYKYVQLARLKRAGYRLAFRDDNSITDIALESGYESPEAFSRAFKQCVGQTPSDFKKQPQWSSWQTTYQPLTETRRTHMKKDRYSDQVKMIDFKEIRLAVLEHHGNPTLLGTTLRRFIDWRKEKRLSPKTHATFNLLYNDPADTSAEDFRLDLGVATDIEVEPNNIGIVVKTIPAGRCAVLRYTGSDDALGEAIAYLYSEWLPQSGEEPRDFPPYLQRLKFFPDVPEYEATLDIFLPLK